MSWSDNKELYSGVDTINWNSKKKEKEKEKEKEGGPKIGLEVLT